MASSKHTTQYQLNQWQAGDPVLREDFNSDNFAQNVKRHMVQRAEGRAKKKCFANMGTRFEWPCGDNAKFAWIASVIR